jgi:hypothetical protein
VLEIAAGMGAGDPAGADDRDADDALDFRWHRGSSFQEMGKSYCPAVGEARCGGGEGSLGRVGGGRRGLLSVLGDAMILRHGKAGHDGRTGVLNRGLARVPRAVNAL